MKYKKVVKGSFVDRPNRFIAHVKIDDEILKHELGNNGDGSLSGSGRQSGTKDSL